MGKTNQVVRGVVSNWIGLIFTYAVTFFLSPYVVHHLGVVAYGVWTIVVSVTGYMAMLDLGLRGGVTRFVSKHHAENKHGEASDAVSAAFWLRQWIGLVIILSSVGLSLAINRFFHIPAELQFSARWAIVLTGLSLSISLQGGVFGGVLAALHRFDLLSFVMILQTVIRASGVVWLLSSGKGILAIAAWELTAVVIANTVLIVICFRMYPELRISFRTPKRNVLHDLGGYSFYITLRHFFIQIIYYTDNIVVGRFVSIAAVTYFSIGGSLSELLRSIASSATATFLPLASRLEAAGEHDELRRLLVDGTRLTLLVTLPIQLALFFRGDTFIGLWMGSQYAPISGRVLQIFLVGQFFALANATSSNIAMGLARLRECTIWAACEASANLLLSIYFVHRMGLYGVAVGTVIPSLFVHLLLWPRFICKVVGLPLREHLWQSWIRPALAAVPFAIACFLTDLYWTASNMVQFALQIGAILPFYVLGVALFFREEFTVQLRSRVKWLTDLTSPVSTD